MDRVRKPPGTPSGGQFAATRHQESDLVIGIDTPTDDEIAASVGRDLDAVVAHPDPEIRIIATANAFITDEHLTNLLDPGSQPVEVRWATARLPFPGIAEVASKDPHPVVKAAALDEWDLSDERRRELEADDDVVHAHRILCGNAR